MKGIINECKEFFSFYHKSRKKLRKILMKKLTIESIYRNIII
ncbi:hypothetical protein HNR33_003855 [Brassicibacter mesophilus]